MRTQSLARSTAVSAVLLMLVALVSPASSPAVAQPAGDFSIDPEIPRATAFKEGSFLLVSGSVPSTAPLTRATFVGIEADGDEVRRNVASTVVNDPAPGTFEEDEQWLENDGGTLDGRLAAPCLFDDPADPCNVAHQEVVEGYLEMTFQGSADVFTSNALPVDYVEPGIQQYVFIQSDVVRVVFTEPVSITNPNFPFNEQDDSGEDWTVNDGDNRVLSVDDPDNDCQQFGFPSDVSGCTRLLNLDEELPGNAPPVADYLDQTLGLSGFRGLYRDAAGTPVLDSGQQAAGDRVRPFIPSITNLVDTTGSDHAPADPPEGVACQEDAFILGNSTSPTLTLDNFGQGDRYIIDVDGVRVAGPTQASTTPFEVTLGASSLDAGQVNVISVVAVDGVGNRSDDSTLSPPGASFGEDDPTDSNALCYLPDVVAPTALGAARTADPRQVLVTFAQPDVLLPGDDEPLQTDAGRWAIDSLVGTAATTDQPYQRLITFASDIPQSQVTVTWTRDPEAATPSYTDAAGNVMRSPTNLPILPPPPIDAPVFSVPSATTPRFVNSSPFTVRGGFTAGTDPDDVSQVLVSVRGSTDDQQATIDGTNWSADVALGDDGPYRFDAFARSIFGSTSPLRDSTQIVLDTIDPEVDLIVPAPPGGGLFGGGGGTDAGEGTAVIEFGVEDVNFDRAELTATFPEDTGIDPVTITYEGPSTGAGGSTQEELEIPGGFSGQVTVELVAFDLAGNVSDVDSGVFNVTDDLFGTGRLVANDAGDTRIDVGFAASLEGDTANSEWSATGGVEGRDMARQPDSTEVVNRESPETGQPPASVLLGFPSPFPGGLVLGAEDDNARPRLSYDDGLFGDLSGPNGRAINVNPAVLDRVPPSELDVASSAGDPAKLDDDDFIATFTGSTDPSSRPNVVTVYRDQGGQPGAVIIPEVVAGTDGAFSFDLPVDPNSTTRVFVGVQDDVGNDGPLVPAQITEDSIGPEVELLVAALDGPDRIEVSFQLVDAGGPDQSTNRGALAYRTDGQDFVPVGGAQSLRVDEQGHGSFTWAIPSDVDIAEDVLQFQMVGTDALGNTGPAALTGLSNVPVLQSATAARLDEVVVTISEPVTTDQVDAAGFSILGGPGVITATPVGTRSVRLALNGDLPTGQSLLAAYNGQGGWAAADGRPLAAGQVPLSLDVGLLPVQDLVVASNCTGGSVLSWVDELNSPDRVTGYEVSRDGEVIATGDKTTRIVGEPTLPDGTYTYSVVTLGQEGLRSDAATVQLTIGDSPVPPGRGGDAIFGGSGAPEDSVVIEDGEYTARPNITREGGFVVSCDGRVAVLVQADVADEAIFAKLVRRSAPPAGGFTTTSDLYQLVGVTADDFTVVDGFDGFAEFSFRMQAEVIADGTQELITTIRHLRDGDEEQAPRVGRDSVASQVITFGSLAVAQADGRSLRVYGPDPAIAADRFATAAALSQTQFRRAGAAVIARADDYPDALSAAPLAAQVGGPVLLSRTASLPVTTAYELRRLGVSQVIIAGGPAAISPQVEAVLAEQGITVTRIGGADRFETSSLIAERVGSVDGTAFLATGLNFADALSASAPAAGAGRPILLSQTSRLTDVTAEVIQSIDLDQLHIVGGTAALSDQVTADLAGLGRAFARSAGPDRYATSLQLAQDMLADEVVMGGNPLMASGDGDGQTSPDALAAGPIGGRVGSYMLLVPTTRLPEDIDGFLRAQEGLRGVLMAGGPVAITDDVRTLVDATG